MSRKRLISLLLIAGLTAWGIAEAGPASAAPRQDVPPQTSSMAAPAACATPPADPDATSANRDRFIADWGPRVADKTFFDSFAKSATVPDDIKAEGFHAMAPAVQAWLVSCLVDNLVAASGEQATADKIANYQLGLDLVIFGKDQIQSAKNQLSDRTALPQGPTAPLGSIDPQRLTTSEQQQLTAPTITAASLPKANVSAVSTTRSSDYADSASTRLQDLIASGSATGSPAKANAAVKAQNSTPTAVDPNAIVRKLGLTSQPLVALVLSALNDLLQVVAKIQAVLFTLPVVNVLATLFYRVCGESATMPLSCSIYLPVGVPVPADLTGDNFPDVLAQLVPIVDPTTAGLDVSVQFGYSKITQNATLPAHLFVVYDPPLINKRIEFGYDGRASTLANSAQTVFTLHNAYAALTGDISVSATVTSNKPGSTEALTFAVKDLVGGSAGHPAAEANPLAGAVQFSPFPTKLTANAHLTHTGGQDEDIVSLQSSTPSTVNAVLTQDTTTTTPQSHRQFTALIDQLPTSVQVDLQHQGEKQIITYTASAPIAHVNATDVATPDVSSPTSYTQSVYDVQGVPASLKLTLVGARDILYNAASIVPAVAFQTSTYVNGLLRQQIAAQALQIPKNMHVTNLASPDGDQQAMTYDADAVLQLIQFGMYNLAPDGTSMNLLASAAAIPTHMQFSQTRSSGVYDFQANAGIGQIQADLSLNGGTVLPLPGDHVTVHKVGQAIGAEFVLTGFQAAHFDGSKKTVVSMNLSPGGQSFDALADLSDPNILASVHVSALPATMSVTIDPVGDASGASAVYSASSVIPQLSGSFTQRDTQTIGSFALTDIPKNIKLTWNTSGDGPVVTYAADSRLGGIEGFYQKAPGDLTFHALVSDLPQYMLISGKDPITFDARNASNAAPATDHIGQITFDFGTDGAFESPNPATPDDHVLLDTTGGRTHAELVYSGLSLATVSTVDQELHAEVRNAAPRLFRMFLTTDQLTADGFVDKVPADVRIDQVGNTIGYTASDPIHEIFTEATRANGDAVNADVQDIPNQITLLFDAAHSNIDWTASDVTGSISATAHLTAATLGTTRDMDAGLTITGIPRHWFANYANGNVDFEANNAGIGSIDAWVTNHTTHEVLAGDFLAAYFDQPSGDLDAALHVSNLTKAAFTKLAGTNGGGFSSDLNMGNHGTFSFVGNVLLDDNTKLTASGQFDHLPSTIHVESNDGRIRYQGNDNPTLTVSVGAGDADALAVTPAPANVHGVSVRDGSANGKDAYKANLYLTGLPDSLDLNTPAGTYSVNNYHPSIDGLVVDAQLNTIAPQPVTLEATQNIGTTDPVSFTFGPFATSTAGDGTHLLSLNYTASRQLGSFNAEATYGNTDDAQLYISNIPGGANPSFHVDAALGSSQKQMNVLMANDIDEITARYRHSTDPSLAFAGVVDLQHVPNEMHFTIGRGAATNDGKSVDVPDFQYHASHAGLHIDAVATGEITSPATATAAAHVMADNIGQDVTAALDGGTHIHVTSTPNTGAFLLEAAAVVDIPNIDLGFTAGPFVNTGHLSVHFDLQRLSVGLEDFSDVGLDLGVTSALTGQWHHFTLQEFSETTISINDDFNLHVDLPDPFGGVDINLISFHGNFNLHNLISHFRITTNQEGPIFSITPFEALLAHCDVTVNARPKPGYNSDGPTISLYGPIPADSGQTPAYLITPNINIFDTSLPDFAVDVVAFFESPYGNHIGFDFGCSFGP